MLRFTMIAASVGLAVGVAISAYARSGNGFQTGPLVVLAMVLGGLGSIASLLLILVGKRGQPVAVAGAFSLAMLLALAILPLLWPYPASPGPVNLENPPESGQLK